MQEAPVVQETAAEAPPQKVMESVAPAMEDAEGEETEEETADTDTAAPTYSSDMPVDEICSMMTYEGRQCDRAARHLQGLGDVASG